MKLSKVRFLIYLVFRKMKMKLKKIVNKVLKI